LNLTKQEQFVLISLSLIILLGSSLHYAFKKFPFLNNIVNFVSSNRAIRKVDINRASLNEFMNVPYIGQKTAQRIINYRRENGRFSKVEELLFIEGIGKNQFNRFAKSLKVQ